MTLSGRVGTSSEEQVRRAAKREEEPSECAILVTMHDRSLL